MAERTGIAWARSTRNVWTGCTKVGPGCDGCYAEAFQRFVRGKDNKTGEAKNWGPGAPRIPHLAGAFKDLRRWNRLAAAERTAGSSWAGRQGFWPVFVNSQSDFFDNDVPQAWRDEACAVFEECEALTILLVTKRIGNARGMLPQAWLEQPRPNVWMGATVVNQPEANRDLTKLLATPAAKHFVSYEPAIEAVDFRRLDVGDGIVLDALMGVHGGPADAMAARKPLHFHSLGSRIDWIIVGGESVQSSHAARPFNIEWARSTIRQCREAYVAPFIKQLGSNIDDTIGDCVYHRRSEALGIKDRAGADPDEWPADLRVQEFPQ